jgi:hypothetical protein
MRQASIQTHRAPRVLALSHVCSDARSVYRCRVRTTEIPPKPDLRAVRILNRTYWSARGWLRPPLFPDNDDFVFAEAAGVMFRTKKLDHAAAIRWARQGARTITPQLVSDAFLASLSTRRPELRSALASYHLARVLPDHEYEHRTMGTNAEGRPVGSICLICGMMGDGEEEYDLSVLSFERLKWGGVRFTDPIYLGFDLSQAAKWQMVEPNQEDLDLMRELLNAIRQLANSDPKARPQQLEKAITGVLREGHYQRRVVLEILAFCGTLQPRGRPNFARGWIRYYDRPEAPEWKNDWNYPMHAWRGVDAIDETRLIEVFPRLA